MPDHAHTIAKTTWGPVDGGDAERYTLKNRGGMEIEVATLGATLTKVIMPDSQGNLADIVLGFDKPEEYLSAGTYFGATVGRYGNRIRRGRFRMDGREYTLACNEGNNHLHGGDHAFDKRLWSAVAEPESNTVRFHLKSDDGDEGFPGKLTAESSYQLGDDDTLKIVMRASVSQPCPINMVHHTYWNLGGHASGPVTNHEIQFDADFYTPVDEELMPTGEILGVAGSPFDFTSPKRIGRDISDIENAGAGRVGGGYDHNLVLRGTYDGLYRVVRAQDPASGRGFELYTTEPGVQFYSGGYLEGIHGKDGTTYKRFAGFTLETQKFPDSPNIAHFPTTRVDPGSVYEHVMEFRFFR
ncbi:MAG: galactose mutarotase [Bauldia sp.]|nr:galactose mutarotase [Bauldia sp.]